MLRNGTVRWTLRATPIRQRFKSFCHHYSVQPSTKSYDALVNFSHNSFITSQTPTMAKRKSSTFSQGADSTPGLIHMPSFDHLLPRPTKRRASQRKQNHLPPKPTSTNPDINAEVLDGPEALRASPDAEEKDETLDVDKIEGGIATHIKDEEDTVPSLVTSGESESSLSDMSDVEPPLNNKPQTAKSRKTLKIPSQMGMAQKLPSTGPTKKVESKEPQFLDPEADGEEEADEEEIQAALSRPPPVHSDYLPLPWKGRLGYVRTLPLFPIQNSSLMSARHVYALICVSQTHLCLVHELVASLLY